jgi:hypothetical protein
MIKQCALVCLCFIATRLLWSSDFCAVHLKVVSTGGAPLASTASLIDSMGRLVLRSQSESGKIDFCDFDFGDHSILIESEGHLPSTISGVRLMFLQTQTLIAVLNQYPWGDGGTNGCSIDLRVQDTDGHPVPFPVLTTVERRWTKTGDKYGRIAALALLGDQKTYRVRAEGYRVADLSVTCGSVGRIEKKVTLRRE